ncbi:helix-turn-helix transcriptional regulator [Priestia megaterium]
MTQQLTEWQIEEWIRDYGYMLREITRLNDILNKVHISESKLTTIYGIEATMPKGSCGKSQEELQELTREEKRLYRFIKITQYLRKCKDLLEGNDKEWTTYDCMLRGMTYKQIAEHLRCSRDTVRKFKENIISTIGKKVTEDRFQQQLKMIENRG